MKRRSKIILGVVFVIALLVLFQWLSDLNSFPLNVIWSKKTCRESLKILAAARTTNELAQAVGSLGCFLTFPDKSWVAIRYKDMHRGMIASSAVVRDSGGVWFQSSRHFCGTFSGVRHSLHNQLSMEEDLRKLGETNNPTYKFSGKMLEMLLLEKSSNLVAARKNLEAMGFKRIDVPSAP